MGKRWGYVREAIAVAVATAKVWLPLGWAALGAVGNTDTACTLAAAKSSCGSSAVTAIFLSPGFTTITIVVGVCWLLLEERKIARDRLKGLAGQMELLRQRADAYELTGARMADVVKEQEALSRWAAAHNFEEHVKLAQLRLEQINTPLPNHRVALGAFQRAMHLLECKAIEIGLTQAELITIREQAAAKAHGDILYVTLLPEDAGRGWHSGENKREYLSWVFRISAIQTAAATKIHKTGVVPGALVDLFESDLGTLPQARL